MKELVFLLEEPSAQAMLEGVLPQILPADVCPRFIPFSGKQDLEKGMSRKIKGYRNPNAKFIVLRDLDSHSDCIALKTHLQALCEAGGRSDCLVRIACRELESFYLADLAAVEAGLELKGLVRQQNSVKFRNPDRLGSPSKELETLTKGLYQKVGGSRAIGPHLDLGNTRSASFRNLVTGIQRVLSGMQEES